MFKRLSALITRAIIAPLLERMGIVDEVEEQESALEEELNSPPDDIWGNLPKLEDLTLDDHVQSLESTELLLKQAINDPLQFLKDYGEEDFFQLDEDDPRVLVAPLPEVIHNRTPLSSHAGRSPSLSPAAVAAPLDQGELKAKAEELAYRSMAALKPRAALPKIKVPKSKKKRKKSKKNQEGTRALEGSPLGAPTEKINTKQYDKGQMAKRKEHTVTKRSGDSFTQQGEAQADELKQPLEYAYMLPYEMVRERSRPQSRYDHLMSHDSYAASERAAAMRTVIDSLDELIEIHEEAVKQKEAFFESIQELIERKQIHFTEADAWWYHYNRATSYLEEQRILKRAEHGRGLRRPPSGAQAPMKSRSPRRELSRIQASVEMAQASANAYIQDRESGRLSEQKGASGRSKLPPPRQASTPAPQLSTPPAAAPPASQSDHKRAAAERHPASPKSHSKTGSGRLFSSGLPHHDLTLEEQMTQSLDALSARSAELELTQRPPVAPPVKNEDS